MRGAYNYTVLLFYSSLWLSLFSPPYPALLLPLAITPLHPSFYNNLSACGGALTHSGDSVDGTGAGFDETITFDLDTLPPNVQIVAIIVTCHDDGASFADVETAQCVLQDFPISMQGKPRPLADVSIGCKGSNTGVVLATLVRQDNDPRKWKVTANGEMCPTGRNFEDCMPTIRKCVDAHLESWVSQERSLSMDKTFNMSKGDSAGIPTDLSRLCVGLGWDCDASVDLDASVIVVSAARQVAATCYYSKKNLPLWGLHHQGDNTTGAGAGDDEVILLHLDKARKTGGPGTSLVVTVNVYSDGKTFSKSVRNAYIRLYSKKNPSKDLARYQLSNGSVTTRGLIFAELYCRGHNQPWLMTATGLGCGGMSSASADTQRAVCGLREASAPPRPGGWEHTRVETSTSCCVVM
jgi:tellurium resistance protein TerD